MKGNVRQWHSAFVKAIFCLPILLAVCAWADEAADRAAIEKVVAGLNDPQQRSALFTADADAAAELAQLARADRGMLLAANQPWSEISTPRIISRSIRFLTPDVSLVDAAITQYGSVIMVRSVTFILALKREGATWRIAALRVPNCPAWRDAY